MSKSIDSFKREVGKNTGKYLSNVLFRDGHSTPYRRVGDKVKLKNSEAKIKRSNNEQLFAIDSAVLKNVDKIATLRFSNDPYEIIQQLMELEIHLNSNKWQNVSIGDNKEAIIRNKFCDALFEKYKQGVRILKKIDPSNIELDYLEKTKRKVARRKIFRKYSFYIGFGFFFFFMVCIAMEETGFALLTLFFSGVFLIFLSSIIYAQIKKKNRKKVRDKRNEQSQPKNLKSNSQESTIFKDLNENNRIENTLFNIWNRYKNSVDSQIINRKPIFSADAVRDSILFVGINPSFNPSDDNYFINSDDGNSLLYGSFYQRPDAPEYFKILEIFANKLNRGYTHINLLYARENNREFLLSCDHNFIREQLELTYETILRIKPVAIIFFSDYCKNLIYGENLWVNPNNKIDGNYTLNGTNLPVFFTDDISIISVSEQEKLISKIKNII